MAIVTALEMRLRRARQLVAANAVQPGDELGHFLVHSQSGERFYQVRVYVDPETGWLMRSHCTCPDWLQMFQALEAVYEVPFHYLLGQGERRLNPSGPVTYCGRQIPSELGEYVLALKRIQRLMRDTAPSEEDRKRLEKWNELTKGMGLEKEPHAIEKMSRYLSKFQRFDPELISAYERW